jgi:hypothetical protein
LSREKTATIRPSVQMARCRVSVESQFTDEGNET